MPTAGSNPVTYIRESDMSGYRGRADDAGPPWSDDPPCALCGLDPATCICPECPTCGEVGNPLCRAHGLAAQAEPYNADGGE